VRSASPASSVDDVDPFSTPVASLSNVKARRIVGRFDTPTAVTRAVGGYVTDADAKKMMPLLNALDEAGYVDAGGRLVNRFEVDADGGGGSLSANRSDLRSYIRDVTISDPARRQNSARDIETFGRFLKRKGIDFSIEPSIPRASERSVKKKKKQTP
jgi:hypothetical protein